MVSLIKVSYPNIEIFIIDQSIRLVSTHDDTTIAFCLQLLKVAATMSTDMSSDQLPPIHDILIVGAGPCGLAVAARLRERTPSALYTDEEHRRFHCLAKHGGKSAVKDRVHRKDSGASASTRRDPNILVLEGEGKDWMTRWHRTFAAFGISHLRSPKFFHLDPGDRDALLGYAYEQGREVELEEIGGVVGKEISKHQVRKRKRSGGRCG